jgi:hypothetical protein
VKAKARAAGGLPDTIVRCGRGTSLVGREPELTALTGLIGNARLGRGCRGTTRSGGSTDSSAEADLGVRTHAAWVPSRPTQRGMLLTVHV